MTHGKSTALPLLLTAVLAVAGCAPYRFGVPEEEWLAMNPAQQQETMRAYNEQERLREIARIREEERRSREEALRATEERRREESARRQIERIYRGEAGQYGDLLRVTIRDAAVQIGDRELELEPVSFKIASGETKTIDITVPKGKHREERRQLLVTYQDGTLLLDEDGKRKKRGSRIVYEPSWKRGASYTVSTDGNTRLKHADVLVEIIPHRTPGHERR